MRKNFRKFRLLAITLVLVAIILIAFVGIYGKKLNAYTNLIPKFELGMDLFGKRELIFNPSTESSEKQVYVDNEGKILGYVPESEQGTKLEEDEQGPESEDTSTPKINYARETRTIKENEDEVLTKEVFEATKKVVKARLDKMGVQEYNIRLNDVTGELVLEIINSADFRRIYNLIESKGEFQVIDSQTGLILMTPDMVKRVSPTYNASESGYQAYLQIEFNKEGSEKLKEISNQYVAVTKDSGTETTYVELKIDGSTLMKTYFGEELSNGIIQISYGEATNDVQKFQETYQNIIAVSNLLNNGVAGIKYNLTSDNFVKANITNTLKTVVFTVFFVGLACIVVYFTFVYGKNGFFAGIANAAYVAVISIVIRYTNVIVTYNSIIAFVLMIALNVIFLNIFLKRIEEYGTGEGAYVDTLKSYYVAVIPVIVLSVIFTFVTNISVASIGMVTFWSLFVQFAFNGIFTRTMFIGLDKSDDDSLERKIEENKKAKKKQSKEKKVASKKSTKKGANK